MTTREASVRNWCARDPFPTWEEINGGSLQRIADAVEKMAENWEKLRKERDEAILQLGRERTRRLKLERSVSTLRGVITRMKQKEAV